LLNLVESLRRNFPSAPIFGCTSYEGVFTREGFFRGAALLAGEPGDGLHVTAVAHRANAHDAREKAGAACRELVAESKGKPSLILMHATPGFEERIVEGIESAIGRDGAIFGGSAADDSVAGDWHVFAGTAVVDQGFALAAFSSPEGIYEPTRQPDVQRRPLRLTRRAQPLSEPSRREETSSPRRRSATTENVREGVGQAPARTHDAKPRMAA
jgi:hypothetical protein